MLTCGFLIQTIFACTIACSAMQATATDLSVVALITEGEPTKTTSAILGCKSKQDIELKAKQLKLVVEIQDDVAFVRDDEFLGLGLAKERIKLLEAFTAAEGEGKAVLETGQGNAALDELLPRMLFTNGYSDEVVARATKPGFKAALRVASVMSLTDGTKNVRAVVLDSDSAIGTPTSLAIDGLPAQTKLTSFGDDLSKRLGLQARTTIAGELVKELRITYGSGSMSNIRRLQATQAYMKRLSDQLVELQTTFDKLCQRLADDIRLRKGNVWDDGYPTKGQKFGDLSPGCQDAILRDVVGSWQENGFSSKEDAEKFARSATIGNAKALTMLYFVTKTANNGVTTGHTAPFNSGIKY